MNWWESDPQQAQAIQQQIEGTIGRSLTPDEIQQAEKALAGDTLDPSKLATLMQQLPRNAQGGTGAPAPSGGGGGTPTSGATPTLTQFSDPGQPFTPTAQQGAGTTSGGPDSSPLFPNFQIPTYHSPDFKQAPAFDFPDFKAPTLEEAQNAPGYQFGVQQGEQALQQSKAAQGLSRTGGTLKDILDYGRQAATQNYGNVFAQDLTAYGTNRANAVGKYNTNYQTQYQDPNAWNFQGANADFYNQLAGNNQAMGVGHQAFSDELAGANAQFNNSLAGQNFGLNQALARFAPQMIGYQTNAANAQRQAELGYNSDWQKFLNTQSTFYNNQNSPFAKYLSLAQLGSANA